MNSYSFNGADGTCDQQAKIDELLLSLADEPLATTASMSFLTVRRYAAIRELRLSLVQMKELDRRTEEFCRELGIQIGRGWDDLFGEVNTYHFEALDDAYAEWSVAGGARGAGIADGRAN